MKFLGYAALAALCVALLPVLFFFLRRVKLALALCTHCRKAGAVLTPLKCFWFLDTIRSGDCSFSIETKDTVYAVKLIGGLTTYRLYHFISNTQYATATLVGETHYTLPHVPYKSRPKKPFHFSQAIPVNSGKTMRPIVLIDPVPIAVTVSRDADRPEHRKPLQCGDFTGEGYLYTWKRLQKEL